MGALWPLGLALAAASAGRERSVAAAPASSGPPLLPHSSTCAANYNGPAGGNGNGSGCGSGISGRRALSVACSAAPGFGAAGAGESTGPRVCILGGGFGGLYTAVKLESLIWPRGTKPRVSCRQVGSSRGWRALQVVPQHQVAALTRELKQMLIACRVQLFVLLFGRGWP